MKMTASDLWDTEPEPVMSGAKVLNEKEFPGGNFPGNRGERTCSKTQKLRIVSMPVLSTSLQSVVELNPTVCRFPSFSIPAP